jgi:hypothetical protein
MNIETPVPDLGLMLLIVERLKSEGFGVWAFGHEDGGRLRCGCETQPRKDAIPTHEVNLGVAL